MASTLTIYSPIGNVDPIITPILTKFRDAHPEFECDKKFEIYNSESNPLFKVSSVETLMGKMNIRQVILDDQKHPFDQRLYTPTEHFVYGMSYTKEGSNFKSKSMFFTRRGFQIYLMTSRGDISNLFRNFLLVVLDELHTKGVVTRNDALRITEEKYKKEIQMITNRLEHANKLVEKEQLKRIEVEETLTETEIINNSLSMMAAHQKNQLKQAHEYSANMNEDFPENQAEELRILKQKYLRTVRVYLVPFEKVKKASNGKKVDKKVEKKKNKPENKIYQHMSRERVAELGLDDSSSDESESDDDDDDTASTHYTGVKTKDYVCEYDYSEFGIISPPDADTIYYYTISPTKKLSTKLGIHIGDLYVSDSVHYNMLKAYLIENCTTSIKGVFLVSFAEMESKLREMFVQINQTVFTR